MIEKFYNKETRRWQLKGLYKEMEQSNLDEWDILDYVLNKKRVTQYDKLLLLELGLLVGAEGTPDELKGMNKETLIMNRERFMIHPPKRYYDSFCTYRFEGSEDEHLKIFLDFYSKIIDKYAEDNKDNIPLIFGAFLPMDHNMRDTEEFVNLKDGANIQELIKDLIGLFYGHRTYAHLSTLVKRHFRVRLTCHTLITYFKNANF